MYTLLMTYPVVVFLTIIRLFETVNLLFDVKYVNLLYLDFLFYALYRLR